MPPALPGLLIDLPRNPVLAVGIPVLLGSSAGIVTLRPGNPYQPEGRWYKGLRQPFGSPPRWLLTPAWTLLYATMGYSSHLLVKRLDITPPGFGRDKTKNALTLFYTQMGLNLAWSPLFFGVGQIGLALVDILALLGTNIALFREARDIDPDAAAFLLPYLGWVGYATYLNAGVWWLNCGQYWLGLAKDKAEEAKDDLEKKFNK